MAACHLSTAFLPRTIHIELSTLSRRAIERQIEELIDLLDTIDGDPDSEESDESGDPLDWGEEVREGAIPRYAIDQSTGPLDQSPWGHFLHAAGE